jgi:hypothetical protein
MTVPAGPAGLVTDASVAAAWFTSTAGSTS